MRQKKQKSVAKENEFYLQLMQQALPIDHGNSLQVEEPSNTAVALTQNHVQNSKVHSRQSNEKNGHLPNGTVANGVHNNSSNNNSQKSHRKSVDKIKDGDHDHRHIEKHIDRPKVSHPHANGVALGAGVEEITTVEPEVRPPRKREKKEQEKEREASEYLQRLEMDTKRLRADLQSSRASEQELRLQVAALTTSEKVSKGEQLLLQHTVEELQNKLQSILSSRAADRQTISNLERRVADERRSRLNCEAQIAQERKNRKQEEARAAQVAAQSSRGECTEACKARRRELDAELQECRSAQRWAEERIASLERENSILMDKIHETDILRSALESIQDKNTHLENNLSAETRIKLDLFSALGEAKRQLEIKDLANRAQEKEIEELKSKIAQVLAVMPNDTFGGPTPSSAMSRVRLSESTPGSTLDPNATAYTPKSSLVTSTEA
ncbi:macoilin [Holotrichia oblita]|uniref:Macoilin n=1 Tax=Holotrichia oblita TaxID=644536 RepID=A0ACB9SN94_HOLOL|nr:macoilin [Holotrichia oblita]